MCGIVGAFSSLLSLSERNTVMQLQVTSVLRGSHSTGMFSVGKAKDKKSSTIWHWKEACDPWAFAQMKQTATILSPKDVDVKFLVGHNRHATIGEIIRKNAHPFQFRNVIGVHNGTIRKRWTGIPEFGTDSEGLYYQINKEGLIPTLKELGNYQGAYALVMYDKVTRRIKMVRNDQRTLSIAKTPGTIYFASEAGHLKWILERNKISITEQLELPVHKVFSWELGSTSAEPEIEDVDIPAPVTYSYTAYTGGQGRSNFRGGGYSDLFNDISRKAPPYGFYRNYNMETDGWELRRWDESVSAARTRTLTDEELAYLRSQRYRDNEIAAMTDEEIEFFLEDFTPDDDDGDLAELEKNVSLWEGAVLDSAGAWWKKETVEEAITHGCKKCGYVPSSVESMLDDEQQLYGEISRIDGNPTFMCVACHNGGYAEHSALTIN